MTPIPPLSLSNEALLTFESVWWWGNGGPFLLNNVTENASNYIMTTEKLSLSILDMTLYSSLNSLQTGQGN